MAEKSPKATKTVKTEQPFKKKHDVKQNSEPCSSSKHPREFADLTPRGQSILQPSTEVSKLSVPPFQQRTTNRFCLQDLRGRSEIY